LPDLTSSPSQRLHLPASFLSASRYQGVRGGRGSRLSVFLGLVFVCASCGPLPEAGTAVPNQVLGNGGPSAAIVASTFLSDIRALTFVAGIAPSVAADPIDQPHIDVDFQAWKNVTVPDSSLLIAISRAGTSGCLHADITRVALTGTTLTIRLQNHQPPCLPHDYENPSSLLAVPLKSLPSAVLTLKVEHPPVDASNNAAYPVDNWTVVDLRTPTPRAPDPTTRAKEGVAAVGAAAMDILKRMHRLGTNKACGPCVTSGNQWYLVGLGVESWADTGLGCPIAGEQPVQKEISCYVVILAHRDLSGNSPIAVDGTFEYHVGGGRAVYCSGP